MEIACGQAQDSPAPEGKQHDQAQHGEIGFGAMESWVGGAVFGGVIQGQYGAIGNLDPAALEPSQGGGCPVGSLGGGGQRLGKFAHGQAGFGPAVSAVLFGDAGAVVELKEGLDLPDHFAAGGLGVKPLPEHGPEGQPTGVEPIAAVGVAGGLGEERLGQAGAKALFELAEGVGANGFDGLGDAGAPGGQ